VAFAPGLLHPRLTRLHGGAQTLVMGILNITPDSFSGDGLAGGVDAALARAEEMVAAGVGILDLGGESTRPGHADVPADEELARVVPVIERLAGRVSVPISIDTRKASVAEAALAAGASVVNDVSGLHFDPRLVDVARVADAPVIIGHWQRRAPDDDRDLLVWLTEGLAESVRLATAAGIPRTRLMVDPGLGFAKLPPVSLEILGRLRELRAALGLPLVIGASRKGFVGAVLDAPMNQRLAGSLATVALSAAAGADAVRVHDVAPAVHVARMSDAITFGWSDPQPVWTPVYLGLGANLGDRTGTIARALQQLDGLRGVRVLRRASLFETAPVGVTNQPGFLNTVVEALTTLSPRALLTAAKGIEQTLGRQSRERWGPREIDIDILLYGDQHINEPGLIVPHTHLWDRRFVVAPLAELRRDLEGPDGRNITDHVQRLAATQEARSLGW
jgi:dihydropteroate synthase